MNPILHILGIVGLCLTFAVPGLAQEWTRFRGPNGTGIGIAQTIPTEWTETDFNWKVALPGVGHSSPVLWGNRIFLTASDEPTARFFVLCLDAVNGEELWRQEFELIPYRRHQFNVFASSTPAVDKDHVYVCLFEGGRAALLAFNHHGATIWRKDLGPFAAQHGSGVSPIVHEGLVILPNEQDGESSLIALDAHTGATRWETPRETSVAAYSTPCLFEPDNGSPALIFNSQSHGISAVAPETGKVLWEYGDAFTQRSVSSPVVAAGLIIGSCGSGGGGNYLVAIRPGDSNQNRKPELAYTIRRSAPYVPTSVAVGARLFLWSDGGIVSCVDAPSGDVLWQERVGGNYFASPVLVDERLFGVSTAGDVVVVRAADSFEVLARNALGEPSHSTPAIAGGRMFFRTAGHLISIGGATTESGGRKAEDGGQRTEGSGQRTRDVTTEPTALPKVRLSSDSRHLVTADGQPFVAFGVNYYRPGTGWAPQVWKQFDRDATQRDFERLRALGGNCVRVFLTFGSFYTEPGRLDPDGLAKFDQFLELAEATGLYVHPTGPDHWEGLPEWARGDRIADETVLEALESFWRLFAARYRGRSVLLGYDLLNEPEVRWDSPAMRVKWNRWLEEQYGTVDRLAAVWQVPGSSIQFGAMGAPESKDAPGDRRLLDYQRFREELADEWTRRQAAAIKAVDPDALVTVGLIQWSVPSLLPVVSHYSGFRPEQQARFLDFLSVHFYPLDGGAYEYGGDEAEARNLAYLESVVREVALPGKPVVIGEFGWYGGGQPRFDQGRHPAATEEQQARWCRRVVETTAGLATGWLNWGFHDHPQAGDVSELTGLLTVDGEVKAWGREFQQLTEQFSDASWPSPSMKVRPPLVWDDCLTSIQAGHEFRRRYYRSFVER